MGMSPIKLNFTLVDCCHCHCLACLWLYRLTNFPTRVWPAGSSESRRRWTISSWARNASGTRGFIETRVIRAQLKFKFSGAKTAVFKPGMPFKGHVYGLWHVRRLKKKKKKRAGATLTIARLVVTTSNWRRCRKWFFRPRENFWAILKAPSRKSTAPISNSGKQKTPSLANFDAPASTIFGYIEWIWCQWAKLFIFKLIFSFKFSVPKDANAIKIHGNLQGRTRQPLNCGPSLCIRPTKCTTSSTSGPGAVF